MKHHAPWGGEPPVQRLAQQPVAKPVPASSWLEDVNGKRFVQVADQIGCVPFRRRHQSLVFDGLTDDRHERKRVTTAVAESIDAAQYDFANDAWYTAAWIASGMPFTAAMSEPLFLT